MQTVAPPIELHGIVRVLVVGEPVDSVRTIRESLQANGDFHVHGARTLNDARELLKSGAFDVALVNDLTWRSPAFRAAHRGKDTAVVLVTTEERSSPESVAGIVAAVDGDRLREPGYLAGELALIHEEFRVRRRRETMARWLEREAGADRLTGLRNRHSFMDYLAKLSSETTGQPVSILVANVIGTSTVNQTYGLDAGDSMLRRASSVIAHCIRAGDVAARIDGDDFAVAIPNADIDLARRVARRMTHEIERLNSTDWADEIPVSLTFGVASGTGVSAEALLTTARQLISDCPSQRSKLIVIRPGRDDDGPDVA